MVNQKKGKGALYPALQNNLQNYYLKRARRGRLLAIAPAPRLSESGPQNMQIHTALHLPLRENKKDKDVETTPQSSPKSHKKSPPAHHRGSPPPPPHPTSPSSEVSSCTL